MSWGIQRMLLGSRVESLAFIFLFSMFVCLGAAVNWVGNMFGVGVLSNKYRAALVVFIRSRRQAMGYRLISGTWVW